MLTAVSKYQKTSTESDTDTEGSRPFQQEQTSSDVKLGQLEVQVGALKEKVDNSVDFRKWFIVAGITLFGIIVAIVLGASNLINNNLSSQRELQKDYYQLLIQDKNDINNLMIELERKNICLQKNSYWDYKNCSFGQ